MATDLNQDGPGQQEQRQSNDAISTRRMTRGG
jgi:hypothetical protein